MFVCLFLLFIIIKVKRLTCLQCFSICCYCWQKSWLGLYILWRHLCEYLHRDICDQFWKYETKKPQTCLNGPFWADQITPSLRRENHFKVKLDWGFENHFVLENPETKLWNLIRDFIMSSWCEGVMDRMLCVPEVYVPALSGDHVVFGAALTTAGDHQRW